MKRLISTFSGISTVVVSYLSLIRPAWAVGGTAGVGVGSGDTIQPCAAQNFNPFCFTASVSDIVATTINLVLFVAFIAALVFLIIGGIRWIISGGDKEGTAKAKSTVTSALIGLVIVIGSWILINLILQFFTGKTGGLNSFVFPHLTPTTSP